MKFEKPSVQRCQAFCKLALCCQAFCKLACDCCCADLCAMKRLLNYACNSGLLQRYNKPLPDATRTGARRECVRRVSTEVIGEGDQIPARALSQKISGFSAQTTFILRLGLFVSQVQLHTSVTRASSIVFVMFALPQTAPLPGLKSQALQRCAVPAAPTGAPVHCLAWCLFYQCSYHDLSPGRRADFVAPQISTSGQDCKGKLSASQTALLLMDLVVCTVIPGARYGPAQRPELLAGRMRNLVPCQAQPSIPSTDPQADDVANMDDAAKRWSKGVTTCALHLCALGCLDNGSSVAEPLLCMPRCVRAR